MTDNFGPLRQAMSDLAEHGGQTDLYARTLHRSRQLRRRAAVATAAAAVAVVGAVGGVITFAAANLQAPAPVPVPPAEPSRAPSPTPSSSPSPSSPSSPPRASSPAADPGCPSAEELERRYELPSGHRFVQSTIECWRVWATVESEGPIQGDGVYLFKYVSGQWRYHSQGSALSCADLGITSGNPPFCS